MDLEAGAGMGATITIAVNIHRLSQIEQHGLLTRINKIKDFIF